MAVVDDLHTLIEARYEAFNIVDENQTDVDLNRIIEKLVKLLYPIQFDKEEWKQNLIALIMDKDDCTYLFGAPFPCPKRPEIYDESIANSATGVIRAKAEAIHRSRITNWDVF